MSATAEKILAIQGRPVTITVTAAAAAGQKAFSFELSVHEKQRKCDAEAEMGRPEGRKEEEHTWNHQFCGRGDGGGQHHRPASKWPLFGNFLLTQHTCAHRCSGQEKTAAYNTTGSLPQ